MKYSFCRLSAVVHSSYCMYHGIKQYPIDTARILYYNAIASRFLYYHQNPPMLPHGGLFFWALTQSAAEHTTRYWHHAREYIPSIDLEELVFSELNELMPSVLFPSLKLLNCLLSRSRILMIFHIINMLNIGWNSKRAYSDIVCIGNSKVARSDNIHSDKNIELITILEFGYLYIRETYFVRQNQVNLINTRFIWLTRTLNLLSANRWER